MKPTGDDKMGSEADLDTEESSASDSDDADTSLGEAFDAVKAGDKETAVAAWRAAMTSLCADMMMEK